jgi:predicted kinase
MKLILIRGLPGSGKSTLAKTLMTDNTVHVEADMYFIDDASGKYVFHPELIRQAHGWCQNTTGAALAEGKDVIVSNTFTTIKELRPYFDMAKNFGIVPTVILAQNQFQNEHNVPEETLKRMRDRFQYDLTQLFA